MSEVFMKVTNKMIYDEIVGLRNDINQKTWRIKLNTWCSVTALTLICGILIGLASK